MTAMTRDEAREEANRRWGDDGVDPGHRYGIVIIRQKKQSNRCEVGYRMRRGVTKNLGVYVSSPNIICGKGRTWEAAFLDADADVAGDKSPIFTAP